MSLQGSPRGAQLTQYSASPPRAVLDSAVSWYSNHSSSKFAFERSRTSIRFSLHHSYSMCPYTHTLSAHKALAAPPHTTRDNANPVNSGESTVFFPQVDPSLYEKELTEYERCEVRRYPEVYFLGLEAPKILPQTQLENCGFDIEGVYQAVLHDHIAYRFELREIIGEGTFSQVFSAFDHRSQELVALKIIKNQPEFYKNSLKEAEILRGMKKAYCSASYCVEMREHFVFRRHRVLVFNLLYMNLHQFVKKHRVSGIPFKQLLYTSYQLCHALSQLHHKGVIHCDLKPHNVMFCSEECTEIRLIDFGTARYDSGALSARVQSRYYRAPEVILGLHYTRSIDMWSFGCILFELVTGRPPFTGEDAHQQLLSIMEHLGYPPREMLEKSPKKEEFFSTYDKVLVKEDSLGTSKVPCSKAIAALIREESPELVTLICSCLQWDPADRPTAMQALSHPFYSRSNFHSPLKGRRTLKRCRTNN